MLILPSQFLRKADLRYALVQHLGSNPSGSHTPSPSALRSAKKWAIASNLLTETELTIEGKLVLAKDPYLEATVTDWLIHFHLSSLDLSLWNYFIYKFLPETPIFTEDELFHQCREVFTIETTDQLRKRIRLILKTYTNTLSIAKITFITEDKNQYLTGNPNLSNPYTVGYLLAKIWERNFNMQSSVLVDQILDAEMGLSNILGVNRDELLQQLDILAENKIIEQRSIRPYLAGTISKARDSDGLSYQIHRCWESTSELLEKAYENDIATPNRPLIQSLGEILDDDEVPDFSQFIEWATKFTTLDAGLNTLFSLAS